MPCDYSKYPKNWKDEIRPRILSRAKNRCEWPECGAENGAEGMRDVDGIFRRRDSAWFPCYEYPENAQYFKIILTIAHMDHDVENNDEDNLRALCQYHHLRLDAGQHARNARKTREKKTGQLSLIED